MRYLSVMLLVSLALIAGCQKSSQIEEEIKKEPAAVSAIWECGGKKSWKFTFAEDGTIPEVKRGDGLLMVLSEGGKKINIGPNMSIEYIYGPCTWQYDEEKGVMKVDVIINNVNIKGSSEEINCTLFDSFEGRVSDDGNTWTAEWKSKEEYDVPERDNFKEGRRLIFKKVSEVEK